MKNVLFAMTCLIVALVFADIETDYFLKEYGYHYYAINWKEGLCDDIAMLIMFVGIYFTCRSVVDAAKKKEHEQ